MTAGVSRGGFDIDLREGQLVEGRVRNLLADRGAGVEVKADHKALKTGNVFLEYEQGGPPTNEWRPSGLAITTADWWVTVLMAGLAIHGILVNPVAHMRAAGRVAFKRRMTALGGDNNQYRGVLVPLGWLVRPSPQPGQNSDGTWGELGWLTESLYKEWG